MHDFNPALYAKLMEALKDPLVRVGTIHGVERVTIHGTPAVKVTLSWMAPKADDEECPDICALEWSC
jgi:hypothetical protein